MLLEIHGGITKSTWPPFALRIEAEQSWCHGGSHEGSASTAAPCRTVRGSRWKQQAWCTVHSWCPFLSQRLKRSEGFESELGMMGMCVQGRDFGERRN